MAKLDHRFTCSRCNGSVQSAARPDRIDGRPVCAACYWEPAPSEAPAPSPQPPPAAAQIIPFPGVVAFEDMDPDERRAFARRAA